MIPENFKTSLNIADKQLPGFVGENENYSAFISFLEAYYEWMAENGNVEERSKNLLNYKDIDATLEEFEQYFFNVFLKYFPEKTIANKRELVKLSKHFYRRKSTASSYKFLFRALYNTDVELYNTRDSILIASDGKWVQGVYLKLNTVDIRFLRTKNLKLFGETTKSVANIERSYPVGGRIEFQISDVKRKFMSGEFIKIVDNDLNDVFFDDFGNIVQEGGSILRAKLVGNVLAVTINPDKRGTSYKVGDPVSFIGGLNPERTDVFTIEAEAEVDRVSNGSVLTVSVNNKGHGFRVHPNSEITFSGGGGTGAVARISAVDTSDPASIIFWGVEEIGPYESIQLNASSYGFPINPTANANTKLSDAFENISFLSYPISTITVVSGGQGYSSDPLANAESLFTVANTTLNVKDLGILAPITIEYGGQGYSIGEEILITGGSGVGAFANVANVDINGTITKASFYQKNDFMFPYGGMGYKMDDLPEVNTQNTKIYFETVSVSSNSGGNILTLDSVSNVKIGMYVSGNGISNVTTLGIFDTNTTVQQIFVGNNTIVLSANLASNNVVGDVYKFDGSSILKINTILGDGEALSTSVSKPGEIESIKLIRSGEDYVSQPNTSLKVVDFLVTRSGIVNETPPKGSFVYQSITEDKNDYQFYGYFDKLITNGETYTLRLYNYVGNIDVSETAKPLRIDSNIEYYGFVIQNITDGKYTNGTRFYGDGTARANAEFLSGTTFGVGKYLNSDGFLSADKVLESDIYNDFTYFITAKQEFAKYKELIYNVIHPAGTQVIGRNVVPSNNVIKILQDSTRPQKIELKYVTYEGVNGAFELIPYNTSNTLTEINSHENLPKPTNSFQVYNLRPDLTDIYLSYVIIPNSYITLTSNDGEYFTSQVKEVDDGNNIIYFQDYKFLTYSNVAIGHTSGNTILIDSLTGSYDLINNKNYANSNNHFFDIVKANDYVFISNNYVTKVESVDYNVNSWAIYTSNTLNVAENTNISIIRNFSGNSIVIDASDINYKFLTAFGTTTDKTTVIDDHFILTENDSYISLYLGKVSLPDTPVYYNFIGIGSDILTNTTNDKIYIPPILLNRQFIDIGIGVLTTSSNDKIYI